jgi:hypothetical protein
MYIQGKYLKAYIEQQNNILLMSFEDTTAWIDKYTVYKYTVQEEAQGLYNNVLDMKIQIQVSVIYILYIYD